MQTQAALLICLSTGNSYNRGRWSNAEYDEAVKAASSTDAGDEQAPLG